MRFCFCYNALYLGTLPLSSEDVWDSLVIGYFVSKSEEEFGALSLLVKSMIKKTG